MLSKRGGTNKILLIFLRKLLMKKPISSNKKLCKSSLPFQLAF